MTTGFKMAEFGKLLSAVVPVSIGIDSLGSMMNATLDFPVWGVPVTTFGAAAVGAGLSLFFGEKVEDKRDFWGQIAAACLFGVVAAVLTSDAFNWEWAHSHLSLFALAWAAVIRWFLQPAIDRGRSIIKEYKFSFKFAKKRSDEP